MTKSELEKEVPAMDAEKIAENLFWAIDNESERLVQLYADADWSGRTYGQRCTTVSFVEKGKHWWSRSLSVDYKMMQFLEIKKDRPCRDPYCSEWHPTVWTTSVYLRSDGKVFVWKEGSGGTPYTELHSYLQDASLETVEKFLNVLRRCDAPTITRIST